jgi:predicted GNAT family N-acyltransferase
VLAPKAVEKQGVSLVSKTVRGVLKLTPTPLSMLSDLILGNSMTAAAVTIIVAPYGSDLYRQCVALREETLRKPLGLTLSDADLADDMQRLHFCAVADGDVIGSVSLKPLNNRELLLKQMAVVTNQRRAKIGAQLLHCAEDWARQEGFCSIILHARVSAQGFYAKFGYVSEGETFEQNTIPHIKMTKRVT